MRVAASSFFFALALTAFAAAVPGCKSKPPEERLFDDLNPPTPNKLAGVYQTVINEAGMSTEIRLQFDKGTLIGAVKCTPTNPALGDPVSVGGQIELDTDALDAATGKFTVADFSMEKTVDQIYCQGGLRGATYDFKVEDLKLTITAALLPEPLIYGKIGDDT